MYITIDHLNQSQCLSYQISLKHIIIQKCKVLLLCKYSNSQIPLRTIKHPIKAIQYKTFAYYTVHKTCVSDEQTVSLFSRLHTCTKMYMYTSVLKMITNLL